MPAPIVAYWEALPAWITLGLAVLAALLVAIAIWWLWWRLPKREANRLALKIRDAKARADIEDNCLVPIGLHLVLGAEANDAGIVVGTLPPRQGVEPCQRRVGVGHRVGRQIGDQLQFGFGLAGACERWLRSLPPAAELEIVAASGPPPDLVEEGEMVTAEEAAMRLRAKLAELVIERLRVSQAPEPRATIKASLRAQVAKLAADAKPTLRLERGRAEAVFNDVRADFGVTPAWAAGLMCSAVPRQDDRGARRAGRRRPARRCGGDGLGRAAAGAGRVGPRDREPGAERGKPDRGGLRSRRRRSQAFQRIAASRPWRQAQEAGAGVSSS
jgi:hypothetical protein